MSTDADAPSADEDEPEDLANRLEGIETSTGRMPEPVGHGATGSVVVNDNKQPESTIPWEVGDGRHIPDGSLYQHARAAWYAHGGPDAPDEHLVLSEDYEADFLDETVAVSLISSGTQYADADGSSLYKYDLTLQPIDDDGEIQWSDTPRRALNVKLVPQRDGMTFTGGDDVPLKFGLGTQMQIQSTFIEEFDQLVERGRELVEDALGYEWREILVEDHSRQFWKAEVHSRFADERLGDVVHTLKQSEDLIPHHGGSLETRGEADDGKWLEAKITTEDWQLLGFDNIDVPILLKVYYPENPERTPFPLNQPKIEAALAGNPHGAKPHADSWDRVMSALREIVLSHLCWAGVGTEDLVADKEFDGAEADLYEWQHPRGRRAWLRDHYDSLVPQIYRQAQRERTQLTYDILDCMVRYGDGVTYDELAGLTGAAKRTIREHVRRLEEMGGDGPGLVKRVRSSETFVTWADAVREHVEDVVDSVKPDDTPDDREERAEERREQREEQDDGDDQEDVDDDRDDDGREEFVPVDELRYSLEEIANFAIDGHLDPQDVGVRSDRYSWIDAPPG